MGGENRTRHMLKLSNSGTSQAGRQAWKGRHTSHSGRPLISQLHMYWEVFLFPCHSQIITSAHLFCVSRDSSCSHPPRRQKHVSSTGGIPSLEPGWKVIATCTLPVVLATLGWHGCQHLLVENYSSTRIHAWINNTYIYWWCMPPSSAVGKLIRLI